MSESKGWSCYILECSDQSYYVGVATDIEDRLHEHNSGDGAKHTRLRRPVRLVWSQPCADYAQARAIETRLKVVQSEMVTSTREILHAVLDTPEITRVLLPAPSQDPSRW
jgi:putative endonuclease